MKSQGVGLDALFFIGQRFCLGALAALAAVAVGGCGSGANVPTTGENSIYQAAFNGDSATVSGFLQDGFDVNKPDKNGWTLLHHAAAGNRVNVLELLTEEHGAKRNVTDNAGKTPLDVAREANARDAIRYLEEAG